MSATMHYPTATTVTAPAGWHPDPGGSGRLRYWDGRVWTDHWSPPLAAGRTHGAGFAVTSMVLGILALLFSFIPLVNVVTFPLALIALPFGGIAMTKEYQGHEMAITGVVTAVLSLGVVIAMISSFSG